MKVPIFPFATFVTAAPTAKLACVTDVKQSQSVEYDPRSDWWKQLREFIPRNHRERGTKAKLDWLVDQVSARKKDSYSARVNAYKEWWGARNIRWVGGSSRSWHAGGVEVSVNPELFVSVDGVRHVVKLYFKASERLTEERVNVVLRLLELTYRNGSSPDGRPMVGVLDLAQGEYYEPSSSLARLDPVLEGEAASFFTIWQSV